MSLFKNAPRIQPDRIFALTAQYVRNPASQKVNLGQGTYRDENGQPYILAAVAQAREKLTEQGLLHEYLPILGLKEFRTAASELALGSDWFKNNHQKVASCQSLSGTGALHLAGLFLKRYSTLKPDVYITEPTWSNHHQVFGSLGFKCHTFRYYDPDTKTPDMESYLKALNAAEEGSIFILHACAHNPTGCDPSKEQWQEIGRIMKKRNLFPLFDAAYLGFNSGNIDEDAYAIRHFVGDLGMEAAVCVSFAKNMGLYGERVGCVMLPSADEETALNVDSVLEVLQRSEVSNPPAYGAKIASTILGDRALRDLWYKDLLVMSGRIRSMREELHRLLYQNAAPGNWDHLIQQSGMFGFLGLSTEIVVELRENYHIYMADNSRVSIAGLNPHNVEYVAKSIAECLRRTAQSTSQTNTAARL